VYTIKRCPAITNKLLIKMIKNQKVLIMNKLWWVNMIRLCLEEFKKEAIKMKNLMKREIPFKVWGLSRWKLVVFKRKNLMKLVTQFKVLLDLNKKTPKADFITKNLMKQVTQFKVFLKLSNKWKEVVLLYKAWMTALSTWKVVGLLYKVWMMVLCKIFLNSTHTHSKTLSILQQLKN